MKRLKSYKTKFVSFIPNNLKQGILYVCIPYDICVHLCACGCKSKIFTPISKENGWVLNYDGVNVSLIPSIGNGAYPCASHYYLNEGEVRWLPPITQHEDSVTQKRKLKFRIKGLFLKIINK